MSFQAASEPNGKLDTTYSLKINDKLGKAYKKLSEDQRKDLAEFLRERMGFFLHGCNYDPTQWR
jgi:hypothetical protein